MKKTNIVVDAVLAVAIVVLFVLHFSGKGYKVKTATIKKDTAKSSMANNQSNLPIAYVNTDSLLNNYKLVDDMQAKLQDKINAYQAKIKNEVAKFQADVKKFQSAARYMMPDEVNKKRQAFMERQQSIQNMQNELSQKLQNKQDTMNIILKKKLTDLLQKNQGSEKYRLVLGVSDISNVLYADSAMNITNQVIKDLNAEYEAQNPPKKEK